MNDALRASTCGPLTVKRSEMTANGYIVKQAGFAKCAVVWLPSRLALEDDLRWDVSVTDDDALRPRTISTTTMTMITIATSATATEGENTIYHTK